MIIKNIDYVYVLRKYFQINNFIINKNALIITGHVAIGSRIHVTTSTIVHAWNCSAKDQWYNTTCGEVRTWLGLHILQI